MLQMLIIGGGIHGVHLAHCLLQQTHMTHDDIRILDPHEELLHEWCRCTSNCGMKYLRSPSVHHIDIDPFSLHKYAKLQNNQEDSIFIHPKDRPSLELFNEHCQMVMNGYRLKTLHCKGQALEIQNRIGYVNVVTSEETVQARHVLLAMGMAEQPLWPAWASRLKEMGGMVNHVFGPEFRLVDLQTRGPVAVIGAGVSGGHLALTLSEKLNATVSMISRRDILVSNFDFDPGWLGPKRLERFHSQSLEERRQRIMNARAKGSVTGDMKFGLDKAVEDSQLTFIIDDILDVECQNGIATLIGQCGRYDFEHIILATGFTETRPGNGFIRQVITEFDLKTAACGFPKLNPFLQWHKRIYVTGPLSELQIGPSARNIAGARHSGKKIAAALNKGPL